MGWWGQFRGDLDKLAAARRQRAADENDARRAAALASFGERCRWLAQVAADPQVDIAGKPEAILPRLDGFASDVVGIAPLADALLERIHDVDLASAAEAFDAFGLPLSGRLNPQQLLEIQQATKALAERTRRLLAVWPIAARGDREEDAADVAEAARQLLDAASV